MRRSPRPPHTAVPPQVLRLAVALTLPLALALAPALPPAVALAADPGPTARVQLRDAAGAEVGQATLVEQQGGVHLSLAVHGLSPGVHGLHLHAVGTCQGPDFKSAGGHFNPTGKKHGWKSPQGHHAGDLPNLTVGPDGAGRLEVTVEGVTLSPGPTSLLGPGGTSLVVHAGPDDEVTDPAGNSGARVACGPLTRS